MQSPLKEKPARDSKKWVFKKRGERIDLIPFALKQVRLVPNPVYGQCWYCGEMGAKHRVIDCPQRIQDELDKSGSSKFNLENK